MPGKDVLLVPTRKEMTSPISQLSAIDTSSTSQKNVIVVSQPSDNTVVPSFYEQHYMDIESECDVQTQDSDFHFYTEVTDHPMESAIKQNNIALEGTWHEHNVGIIMEMYWKDNFHTRQTGE